MSKDNTGSIPVFVRRRWLPVAHYAADGLAWVVAIVAAWWLRYDFSFGYSRFAVYGPELLGLCALSALVVGLWGFAIGLYRRQWRYGSFDESIALAITMLATGTVVTIGVIVVDFGVAPRSVPVAATGFALSIGISGRSLWRLWTSRAVVPVSAEPIVIVGAGETGSSIIKQLQSQPDGAYRPIALIDDDPEKARLRIQGVPVAGTVADISRVVSKFDVETVLIAVPSAPQSLLRRVAAEAARSNVRLMTVPAVNDLLADSAVRTIRPITEEELLGRPPSDIDTAAVAGYITGRRVLVTGAGGSIGSELCRQLHRFQPSSLVMLDRDESGLHATQLSIDGRAMLDDPHLVLADLRDRERLDEVFTRFEPEVIFHAAALKHLTLLEGNPREAWKSNVVVTNDLLAAARRHGVGRFVNISTDKAADPVSVLGMSKRLTERLTAGFAKNDGAKFLSVRFGNVLGSRGSVLTAFEAQAAKGGPMIVTDPDVTRYFMTIEEAVQLTIYAGAIGSGGEVLVLDMGEPVSINDVARRFAQRGDPPLSIEYVGLRPGEKLHEVLLGENEPDARPIHPLISHVAVPPLEWIACDERAAGVIDRSTFEELVRHGVAEPVV